MELESPSLKRKESYLSLVKEFRDSGERLIPFTLSFPTMDFDAFLNTLKDCSNGIGIPSGFVSHETFWLVCDEQVVAVSNLRHRLTDALKRDGGHIGYGVRPSARRNGYGTKALAETLKRARKRDIADCLLICHKGNIGSAKAIAGNGGILDSEEFLYGHPDILQRYWIKLGGEAPGTEVEPAHGSRASPTLTSQRTK